MATAMVAFWAGKTGTVRDGADPVPHIHHALGGMFSTMGGALSGVAIGAGFHTHIVLTYCGYVGHHGGAPMVGAHC